MKDTAFLGRINTALSNFPVSLTGGMVAAVWIGFVPPFVFGVAVALTASYTSLTVAAGLALVILLVQVFLVARRKTQKV